MVEWIDLDELLDKDIGDIREMLAHEDSDTSFRTFLTQNGWIVDEENEYDDDYEEEEDYEDDEEEGMAELPSEEEKLAQDIADDISNGKYDITSLVGMYPGEIIARIKYLSE